MYPSDKEYADVVSALTGDLDRIIRPASEPSMPTSAFCSPYGLGGRGFGHWIAGGLEDSNQRGVPDPGEAAKGTLV